MGRLHPPHAPLALVHPPLKAPKIRLRRGSIEIHMHDIQVVTPAPHLQSPLGKASLQPPIIAHGYGPSRPAGYLIGAFRADDWFANTA